MDTRNCLRWQRGELAGRRWAAEGYASPDELQRVVAYASTSPRDTLLEPGGQAQLFAATVAGVDLDDLDQDETIQIWENLLRGAFIDNLPDAQFVEGFAAGAAAWSGKQHSG